MIEEQKEQNHSEDLATLFQVLEKREKAGRFRSAVWMLVIFVLIAMGYYQFAETANRRGFPDEFPMQKFHDALNKKNNPVFDSMDFYLARLEVSENKSRLASLLEELKSNREITFEELAPNTVSTRKLYYNKSAGRVGCDTLKMTSTNCFPGELYWPCCLAWSTRPCDTIQNKTIYPCKPDSPTYPCCQD